MRPQVRLLLLNAITARSVLNIVRYRRKFVVVVEVLLYIHRNRGFITILGTGAQDVHIDFHTVPELVANTFGVVKYQHGHVCVVYCQKPSQTQCC